MKKFELDTVLSFEHSANHPDSRIIGIDHYDFAAVDGENRQWQSYTLIPENEADRVAPYDRWYVVDLPYLGLSFVQSIAEKDMPANLTIDEKLTGQAVMNTEGDGELGTGNSDLVSYWDKNVNPPVMYAKETFEDNSILYFKTYPLVGLLDQ